MLPNDMLQYVSRFRSHAMYRIDSVILEDDDYLREHIGMENEVIGPFREHIEKMASRAKKGKGRAREIKEEDDDENQPIVID